MKKTLLFLLFIASMPAFAQQHGKEYRISKMASTSCGDEQSFVYSDEISVNPVCIKNYWEGSDYSSIDSLYYNELGLLSRIDKYFDFGNYVEMIDYIIFTYNDKGLRIKQETYSPYKGGGLQYITSFTYDENDNMITAEVDDAYGFYREKLEISYNADGLRTEDTYSYDEGNGYVVEELLKYYYENSLLVKEEWYYLEDGTPYLDSEVFYEYDEYGNCIAWKEFNDENNVEWMTEYHHDLSISNDKVYYYSEPDNFMFMEPSHNNMITGYTEYFLNDNDELEVGCEYEYSYDVLTDAVEEISIDVNIYPNPAESFVNIEVEDMDFVELYDVFGKRLYSEEGNDKVQIDMSPYSSGVYLLRIYSEGKSYFEKIIRR